MLSHDASIQIVEIKKPNHKLKNDEMDRINTYIDLMKEFFAQSGNDAFKGIFSNGFHVTLVCDGIGLTGVHKTAFDQLKVSSQLTHFNWQVFLLKTRKAHEGFLAEAERQRKNAVKE